MRYWSKPFLFLCALCAILAGACASSSLRGQWNHQILRSGDPSSREYREEGQLLYQGRPVPESFSAIICPIGSFVYRRSPVLVASSSGWLRDEADKDSLQAARAAASREGAGDTANGVFGKEDALRGWYEAAFEARKSGTPAGWIWVIFGKKSYWMKSEGVFYYPSILAPPP